MFHDVLLPLAGTAVDAAAIPHAIAMASLTDASVHLVHVLERSRGAAFDPPVDPLDWHVRKLEAEAYLDRVAARFRDAGIQTDVVLLEGQVPEHILRYARHANTDLIVMATGSAGRGSVGTVVGQVLWRSYVSALLVRAGHEDGSATASRSLDDEAASPYRAALPGAGVATVGRAAQPRGPATRIEAAHASDEVYANAAPAVLGSLSTTRSATAELGDSRSGHVEAAAEAPSGATAVSRPVGPGADEAQGATDGRARVQAPTVDGVRYRKVMVALDCSKRAECVLPFVHLLGQRHEASIVLAHVVTGPELPRLMPATEEDVALARRLKERNVEEAGKYLKDVQVRLAVDAETRLHTADSVSPRLHDLAKSEDIDLVVMSAHGYTGESRWPYGDVATNFIGYGDTPLLLIQDAQPQPDAQAEDATVGSWGH